MEVWLSRVVYTLTAFFIFAIVIYVLHRIITGKLKRLRGYQKLADIFYGVIFLIFCLCLLYIWGILGLLVSLAATLGIIGVIFGFAIMNVWLSNAIAGVSLIFDKLISVGSRIKIDGEKGRVTQISLTSTKLITDDGKLLVIPNKSFRDRPYLILEIPQKKKFKVRQPSFSRRRR